MRSLRALPPALERAGFEIVRPLPTRGGQADLLLVRDPSGQQRLVKLYSRAVEIDDAALRLLGQASPDHVVPFESGIDHGVHYEVMEYFEHGSLRDVIGRGVTLDPAAVARELGSAVEHIHSLRLDGEPDVRLVHRDLKPENVLVRTLDPLDLVLGDLGLVKRLAGTVSFSSAWGNGAYAPPEAGANAVSTEGDWWAVGMIVAEVAGGRHPFSGPEGERSAAEIAWMLSQGPVPVEYLGDERIRLLCRGLLTRDRSLRWGADELRSWCAGESPEVYDDQPVTSGAAPVVELGGVRITDPGLLGDVLQRHWNEGLERLFQARDAELRDQVDALLTYHRMEEARATLREAGREPVRLFARLLSQVQPALAPRYGPEGIPLDAAQLAGVAAIAAGGPADPDAPAADVVRRRLGEVRTFHVLSLWRHLPGMQAAGEIEQRWVSGVQGYEAAVARLPEGVRELLPEDLAEWTILQWALDPQLPAAAAASLESSEAARQAERVDWWAEARFHGERDLGALLVAHLTVEPAHEVAVSATAARRHAQDVEAERQQTASIDRRRAQQGRSLPRYRTLMLCSTVILGAAAIVLLQESAAYDIVGGLYDVGAFRSVYDAWPVRPGGPLDVLAVGGDRTIERALGGVAAAAAATGLIAYGTLRHHLRRSQLASPGLIWIARVVGTLAILFLAAYLPIYAAGVVYLVIAIIVIAIVFMLVASWCN